MKKRLLDVVFNGVNEMTKNILKQGRVAVITGAAKGIGAEAAQYFAEKKMHLVLFDKDEETLVALAERLDTPVRYLVGDVCHFQDLQALLTLTYKEFGECALLFNNAGIMQKTNPTDAYSNWQQVMDINLASIVNLQHLFVPRMLEQQEESAIVNVGSKEGITTPPGNVAYSVSKAGVKILTEHLEHSLRQEADRKVTTHLLVPGYTWTPMNFPGANFEDVTSKPAEPWTARELMEYFETAFVRGDFYIIARDNEVTEEMDAKRMRWAMDDLIYNRPALSRWHRDYEKDFQDWLEHGVMP